MAKKRLNPESFDFPVEEIKSGLYSDIYFTMYYTFLCVIIKSYLHYKIIHKYV